MITTFRTMAAAGTAALALAGGAALTGATAQADDRGEAQRMPDRPAQRALISNCGGGPLVAMSSRSMDYQGITAGATVDVEGSQWQLKGPKKGTDTVLVTLTSMASSGGSGELTYMAFYKDGVGTNEGTKYYTYDGILDQATVQFCTKIGKGQHTLVLKATDGSGGTSSLYYPTVTYQRFG